VELITFWAQVDYFFGNLDERRIVWSVGRDLTMRPPQDDGPVNSAQNVCRRLVATVRADWTQGFSYALFKL